MYGKDYVLGAYVDQNMQDYRELIEKMPKGEKLQ